MKKNRYVIAISIVAVGLLAAHLRLEAKETGIDKSVSDADIRAREAAITGNPPRILPAKQEEIGPEAFESINSYRARISLPPLTELPDILATLWKHRDLYLPTEALTLQLARGELPKRARELAILRVGWLCQSPFVWGEHVKIGKREVRLSAEEIERVTVGAAAPGWNEIDRAVLRAVEELIANAMISDEVWAVLAKNLNEKQLIELPVLVSKYQGAAYLANSARIRLMPGNQGLMER